MNGNLRVRRIAAIARDCKSRDLRST